MTRNCDINFAKKYKVPSPVVQLNRQKYVYKAFNALSFYAQYLYLHLTHLLLPLKVHTKEHVSALSDHHQALL